MKKISIILLLFIGLTVKAQEKSAFEKDANELVQLISKPLFGSVVDQMASLVKPENVTSFKKDVEATYPDLFDKMAKIYMEEMTHEDIKAIKDFYNTSVGKKLLSKQPILQKKGMLAGQSWGMNLQSIVAKYQ